MRAMALPIFLTRARSRSAGSRDGASVPAPPGRTPQFERSATGVPPRARWEGTASLLTNAHGDQEPFETHQLPADTLDRPARLVLQVPELIVR